MKRVGIVTFHNAHNYGAVLQCVALRSIVAGLGYEAEVIGHRNENLERVYALSRGSMSGLSPLLKLRRLVSTAMTYHFRRVRVEKFRKFIERHIEPMEESRLAERGYAVIVWGSDQIWRHAITGADSFYWGEIGEYGGKRISYAASAGKLESAFDTGLRHLSRFAALGVRESELRDYLSSRGLMAELNLDPVLLLSADRWRQLLTLPRAFRGDYVLVYAMRDRSKVMDAARRIASEKGLPIREIFNNCIDPRFVHKPNYACSPEEFVSAIMNATAIVTDSFHGTAFSIVFNRPFVCVRLDDGQDNRVASLLTQLDIEKCHADAGNAVIEEVDYDEVNLRLNALREVSRGYLAKNLIS